MPSPVQMMKLPAARAGQIKALAEAKGITATEAVEHLLNVAIQAGEIPDTLPGFEVSRFLDLISLTLNGQEIPAMPPGLALAVANDFELAGTAMKVGKGRPRFYGQNKMADMDRMLVIGRHGAGVVAVFELIAQSGVIGEGARYTAAMTRCMAVDLARQIRATVGSDLATAA